MKILIGEDNPADARLVREMLNDALPGAFELEHVKRLHEVTTRLREDMFEALLLDLGLPDSQGIDTLVAARSACADTPIVVLTGRDDRNFAVEVVAAGAQDYLVKGQFNGELLGRTIRYAIERHRAEEKIRHLASIVDSSSEGIISTTIAGTIVSWNHGAEQIYGYSAGEMVGTPMARLFPANQQAQILAALERLKNDLPIEPFETKPRRKDAQDIDVFLSISAIRSSRGSVIAASMITTDITNRKRTEAALEQSHAELRRFNDLAVGRELRIIELKQQVNELSTQLHRNAPYPLRFLQPNGTNAGDALPVEKIPPLVTSG